MEMRPHLKKIWSLSKLDGFFLARMEDLLWLYSLLLDLLFPVVCFGRHQAHNREAGGSKFTASAPNANTPCFDGSYPRRIRTLKKIRLVQDDLNTHGTSAFYETFSPGEAFALAQRFEFHYTPKKEAN